MKDGDERVGLSPLNDTKDNIRINQENYNEHTKNFCTIILFQHSPFAAVHCDCLSLCDAGTAEKTTVVMFD